MRESSNTKPLTVADLIAALSKLDPAIPVTTRWEDGEAYASAVVGIEQADGWVIGDVEETGASFPVCVLTFGTQAFDVP